MEILEEMMVKGGNFNCDLCPEYEVKKGRHYCTLYRVRLNRGNVPGKWIVPCYLCRAKGTFGGS